MFLSKVLFASCEGSDRLYSGVTTAPANPASGGGGGILGGRQIAAPEPITNKYTMPL